MVAFFCCFALLPRPSETCRRPCAGSPTYGPITRTPRPRWRSRDRAKAAEARIEVHKAFERPSDRRGYLHGTGRLGRGLHFIWGSEPWLPLHDKHELTLERAVGLHYTMNPEVAAENETSVRFTCASRRRGRPEGDQTTSSTEGSDSLDRWSGPPAASRWPRLGGRRRLVDSRSPDEIRAHYKAVERCCPA